MHFDCSFLHLCGEWVFAWDVKTFSVSPPPHVAYTCLQIANSISLWQFFKYQMRATSANGSEGGGEAGPGLRWTDRI